MNIYKNKKNVMYTLLNLYTTQRLGLSFIFISVVAILRKEGVSLEKISSIYLLGIFWSISALWAPIIDRISFWKIGHYKGWIFIMQSLLTLSILFVGMFSIQESFNSIFILILCISFFSCTQDIALDALACQLLERQDRGIGNAIQVGGGMLGQALGGGIVLALYPIIGWQYSTVFLSFCTALSLLHVFYIDEPKKIKKQYPIFQEIQRFWKFWDEPEKRRWLLLLIIHPAGVSLAYGLLVPVLVDIGWSLERIGFAVNVFAPCVGLVGALGAGYFIRLFGRRNILIFSALSQIPGIIGIVFILKNVQSVVVFLGISLIYIGYAPTITILSTIMMDKVSKENPAIDYTLQCNIFCFLGFFSAGIANLFSGIFSYEFVIVLGVLLSMTSVIISIYSFKEI